MKNIIPLFLLCQIWLAPSLGIAYTPLMPTETSEWGMFRFTSVRDYNFKGPIYAIPRDELELHEFSGLEVYTLKNIETQDLQTQVNRWYKWLHGCPYREKYVVPTENFFSTKYTTTTIIKDFADVNLQEMSGWFVKTINELGYETETETLFSTYTILTSKKIISDVIFIPVFSMHMLVGEGEGSEVIPIWVEDLDAVIDLVFKAQFEIYKKEKKFRIIIKFLNLRLVKKGNRKFSSIVYMNSPNCIPFMMGVKGWMVNLDTASSPYTPGSVIEYTVSLDNHFDPTGLQKDLIAKLKMELSIKKKN